jgi:RNA polymerase sigma factor (sigma-70 family)
LGRFTSGAFDTDDIAQETWIRLTEGAALERFQGSSKESLRAYVYKCARFVALELYRSERRRQGRQDDFATMLPDRIVPEDAALEVVLLLERFQKQHPSSKCPRILLQAYFYGTPYDELAREYDVEVNAMRKRVFDCKRRIRAIDS